MPGTEGILNSGAGVTFCIITAVIAGSMFIRPDAIPAWLRVAFGSAGKFYGLLNLLTWFVLAPQSWWMGLLHIPLFTISLALAITSWRQARRPGVLP